MEKSFGQIKHRVNELGGTLQLYHIAAIKSIGKHGSTIYERELAETLREIEQLSPCLISITKYNLSSNTFAGAMPYFTCFRTGLGNEFLKLV